jgi:hypothetical protein
MTEMTTLIVEKDHPENVLNLLVHDVGQNYLVRLIIVPTLTLAPPLAQNPQQTLVFRPNTVQVSVDGNRRC